MSRSVQSLIMDKQLQSIKPLEPIKSSANESVQETTSDAEKVETSTKLEKPLNKAEIPVVEKPLPTEAPSGAVYEKPKRDRPVRVQSVKRPAKDTTSVKGIPMYLIDAIRELFPNTSAKQGLIAYLSLALDKPYIGDDNGVHALINGFEGSVHGDNLGDIKKDVNQLKSMVENMSSIKTDVTDTQLMTARLLSDYLGLESNIVNSASDLNFETTATVDVLRKSKLDGVQVRRRFN